MKNKLNRSINTTFVDVFGKTPLLQRVEDIYKQATAAKRFTDYAQLKDKLGDLLTSTLQGCNELNLNPEELILNSLAKIQRRAPQYKGIGRKIQVAILGGAFDPITKGHTELAKFVLSTSGKFDEVWIMPCFSHMLGKKMTSPAHRLAMCRLAVSSNPSLKVFDYEIVHKLGGETYHFIKKLQKEKLAETHEFSLIIGLDNANSFDKWVNYQHLERSVAFTVVGRKGVQRNPKVNWYLNQPHLFLQPEDEIPEISSTMIRTDLRLLWEKNQTTNKLHNYLDPLVLTYIKQNKLYQATPKK